MAMCKAYQNSDLTARHAPFPSMHRRLFAVNFVLCLVLLSAVATSRSESIDSSEFEQFKQLMQQEMSRESKMDATITSVGKHSEKLSETAAVYVVSQDDMAHIGF